MSIRNGIVLGLMTRLGEIKTNTYSSFGSSIHETIKDNNNNLTRFKVQKETENLLNNMSRIKKIISLKVIMDNDTMYLIRFKVLTVNDGVITGEVRI